MSKLLVLIFIYIFVLFSNYFVSGQSVQCGSTSCPTAPNAFRKCFIFTACSGNGCSYSKMTCQNTHPANACKTLIGSAPCDSNTGILVCSYGDVPCNDNNTCTNDSCDPNTGCVFTSNIDDGDACTVDSCGSNGPIHTPIDCIPDKCHTASTCDPLSGCVYNPITCNDNNPCTDDSCNPSSGCINIPNYKDNNTCTIDTCGSDGIPIHTPVKCPPKKFLDILGLGLLCCPQICDSNTGGCIRDPNALPLPLLLCVD